MNICRSKASDSLSLGIRSQHSDTWRS